MRLHSLSGCQKITQLYHHEVNKSIQSIATFYPQNNGFKALIESSAHIQQLPHHIPGFALHVAKNNKNYDTSMPPSTVLANFTKDPQHWIYIRYGQQ
jgi:hypothetical protein